MAFVKYPKGTPLSDGTVADGNTEYNNALVTPVGSTSASPVVSTQPQTSSGTISFDVGRSSPYNVDANLLNALKSGIKSGQLTLEQAINSIIQGATGTNADAFKMSNPASQIRSYLLNGLGEVTQGGKTGIYTPQGNFAPTQTTVRQSVTTGQGTTTQTSTKAPPSVSLQPGQTGDEVKKLQDFLVSQGKMTQAQVNTGYGTYGPQTTAAVKAWQEANGVDNSSGPGYWGPRSIAVATHTGGTSITTPESAPQPSTPTTTNTGGSNPHDSPGYNPATDPDSSAYNPNAAAATGDYSSPSGSYYGKTKNSDWEQPAFQEEQFAVKAAGDAGIVSKSFLESIANDPAKVGFYVNALAYGGYTIGDILNDMKRSEMVSQGNEQAKTIKLIDPEMNKTAYQATAEGQKAYREAASVIPTFQLAGNLNPEILKYGSNIPDELFKTLVPLLDNKSQEFKDAVANVKSAFYDMANQQLQASTEQEKAVADYNYQQFKDQIERQYGILLSDDANKAWKQIEDLENNFSTRGISGSGLQNEAIDDYLRSVREQDQRLRDEKMTRETSEMAAQYRASATPAQIAALIAEDKAKGLPKEKWRATLWGLVPSDDIIQKYDMNTLRAQFPDQTDAELKAYRDAVLDENGNYRSTLYQKYYSNLNTNLQSKKATAETQVLQDALNKENKAYRNYDQSQPFGVATAADNEQMKKDAEANPNPANQPTNSYGEPTGSGVTYTNPHDAPGYNPANDPTSSAYTGNSSGSPTSQEAAALKAQLDAAAKAVANIQKTVNPSYTAPTTSYSNPVSTNTTTTSTTGKTGKQNIYNPSTGKYGYQLPGSNLQPGWQWA